MFNPVVPVYFLNWRRPGGFQTVRNGLGPGAGGSFPQPSLYSYRLTSSQKQPPASRASSALRSLTLFTRANGRLPSARGPLSRTAGGQLSALKCLIREEVSMQCLLLQSLLPCQNPFFPISLEEPPDPTREQKTKMVFYKPKITISDDTVTSAVHLTLKQSLIPCFLGHYPLLPLLDGIASRPEVSVGSQTSPGFRVRPP